MADFNQMKHKTKFRDLAFLGTLSTFFVSINIYLRLRFGWVNTIDTYLRLTIGVEWVDLLLVIKTWVFTL